MGSRSFKIHRRRLPCGGRGGCRRLGINPREGWAVACGFPNLDLKSASLTPLQNVAQAGLPFERKTKPPCSERLERVLAPGGPGATFPRPGLPRDLKASQFHRPLRAPGSRHFPLQTPARVGGSAEAILFVFFSSGFCHGNADTTSRRRPSLPGTEGFWDPAGARRALRTPRETAGRDQVPVGAGGARRSAPALGSLPPRGSPQAPSPRRGLRVAFGKTQPRNI